MASKPSAPAESRNGIVWAKQQALELFGPLGVVLQHVGICYVGRFRYGPDDGEPPWPVALYGEGPDWISAVDHARTTAAKNLPLHQVRSFPPSFPRTATALIAGGANG